MRLRDIADCVGITERAAHQIVCELEEDGYLTRRRNGRRSVYSVHTDRELPHALERGARVADLLRLSPSGAIPDHAREAASA
jgi:predicted transcriptional regulator of viral defense system